MTFIKVINNSNKPIVIKQGILSTLIEPDSTGILTDLQNSEILVDGFLYNKMMKYRDEKGQKNETK